MKYQTTYKTRIITEDKHLREFTVTHDTDSSLEDIIDSVTSDLTDYDWIKDDNGEYFRTRDVTTFKVEEVKSREA